MLINSQECQKSKFKKIPNFILWNIEKPMVPCKSAAQEVSSEWSHHRISSIGSKVRTTSHVSIIDSESERVKATYLEHCRIRDWCKIIGPRDFSQSPTETGQHKTKDQQDCKLHDCRNTEPPHNGDEDPEPERTIRQKKQEDINCMEEKVERMECMRNYRTQRPQPKPHETAAPQGRSQIRLGIHTIQKHKGAGTRRFRTQKQSTQTAEKEKCRNARRWIEEGVKETAISIFIKNKTKNKQRNKNTWSLIIFNS